MPLKTVVSSSLYTICIRTETSIFTSNSRLSKWIAAIQSMDYVSSSFSKRTSALKHCITTLLPLHQWSSLYSFFSNSWLGYWWFVSYKLEAWSFYVFGIFSVLSLINRQSHSFFDCWYFYAVTYSGARILTREYFCACIGSWISD